MKSGKCIEKMLKKHYKKAKRTVGLPTHKNVTVGGQTVSLYAPRRNIFVSAAAFAIYAIGLVSMVTLFILAGGKAGLFQPEETDDRGAAGSVSNTVMTPETNNSPVIDPTYSTVMTPETNNPPVIDPTYGEWIYHPYEEVENVYQFKKIRQNLMQKYFERIVPDYPVFGGFDYSEEDIYQSATPVSLLDSEVTTNWRNYPSAVVWSMSKPVYVDGYIMINADDQATYKDRSPIKWQLYGANELPVDHMDSEDKVTEDGYSTCFDAETVPIGWVLIDAVDASDSYMGDGRSLLPDDNSYEIAFKAENPGSYKYFMLVINEVEESGFRMAEFLLYGYEHRQTGERIQAIRDAWYERYGRELEPDAYYGTFNGKDVFLHLYWDWADTVLEVAGCVFCEGSTFDIFVFDNGEFIRLQDAYYERGLLTAEQIGDIADLHTKGIPLCEVHDYGNNGELDLETAKMIIAENDDIVTMLQKFARFHAPDYMGGSDLSLIEYWLDEDGGETILFVIDENRVFHSWYDNSGFIRYEQLFGEEFHSNWPVIKPLTNQKRKEIESAWLADKGEELEWSYLYGVLYYGTYGDCVVMLDASGERLQAEDELIVASSRFKYTHSFEIAVYHDGKFIGLKEAYESKLLSEEQIVVIAECHVAALKDNWGMLYYEAFEKDWHIDNR